ncbi:MAG: 4-alpha-glucanotransferase, partial [Spirochaetaceae bacterium]|nr:4-alpha-glucanotransferase [Spirochaetaceae bacterium]
AKDLAGWSEREWNDPTRIDFLSLIPWKNSILQKAFVRFQSIATPSQRADLDRFRHDDALWVDDYALFMALKEVHEGVGWPDWRREYRDRDPQALREFAIDQSQAIDFHTFVQWIFHDQWHKLRALAATRGISLIGDIPIFVSLDSADVWASRRLFQLDESGRPTVVAGVPPDYFSDTGQLWGNPIYQWDEHEKTGFEWWQRVLVSRFDLFDYVRVDHFRGFCAYWAIPFGEPTAAHGQWIPAPGEALFRVLEERIGRLPIIAEDLGVITPDVVELIDRFGFPGMKVLQFGFDEKEQNDHLPHGYVRNSVVYTGTHDNDTVLGWLASASDADRSFALRYLASDGTTPHWDFIRGALASPAQFAITPMQDLLGLDSEARMNRPGTLGGNWQWRMSAPADTNVLAARLREITQLYGRSS